MLINSLILLAGIAIALGGLFWKNFAKRPGERTRAVIATIIGTIGMAIFFGYVAFLTYEPDQNIITFIKDWFEQL